MLEERDGVISALSAEVLTVLEILATMCANNKNVPQGFKDVVSLKYARCVSLIEDSEKVGSFFAAIKKAIEKKAGKPAAPAKKPAHKANRSARLVKKVEGKQAA